MNSSIQEVPRIPGAIDFPNEELKIINLWDKWDAFKTSLRYSKHKLRYSFYDGPPFATGLPHYGHILAGTVKDVITRYAYQRGYHVERRFGWDCHGLPVEFEVDKVLGITAPNDVEIMGVARYNNECRQTVTRYVDEWKNVMNRIGRWTDFENDYKTLYPWFMESVWWVFKQLYLKGLVYHGSKVMPYSTGCHTPLSNFESSQNYKEVFDPAVTVSLPLIGDGQGAALLIWTTTPWTLPCNLAVCVNPSLIYVKIREISSNRVYILLKTRIEFVFKENEYVILEEFNGDKLIGLKYESLFPYYRHMSSKGAFKVLSDDYVTAESGTGIVHQAPYFGEDDYRVCLAAGIITPDEDPVCPIDANGCITEPVADFKGQYFKDADKHVISMLKNRLVKSSYVKHSYPYCWRSDTPLIYKAIPSWFIRVQHMSERLQEVISETYWVPQFVKEKRFWNWLKQARDWAISRNRYWGTPIPIWISPDGEEICCVGSIAELEELTGTKITDLHRESIDGLEIPSKRPGNPALRRIPEVFDCWFESGSMPYAQQHFPFENQKEFFCQFPADFVAEGIDQTRGWFYTLLVISTALFSKPPFKNVIASGLILASDGQKMSKRKKNYPDPMQVVTKYGADALRLYLINSPVVRAENLRFKEAEVQNVVKDVLLPWFNSFRFLMQNIDVYVQETMKPFYYDEAAVSVNENVMDRWILSFTQSLLVHVEKEMGYYHLYNVVPYLVKYFDHLTNWYVRMNRKRLKGEESNEQNQALTALFKVLFTITRTMAPFTPFFSEYIFQNLHKFMNLDKESVHYLISPKPDDSFINKNIERIVQRLQQVIELGRIIRDKKAIPIKYPLSELIVIHQDKEYLSDIKSLESYLLAELNVHSLIATDNKERYGIKLQAKPNYKTLGMLYKSDYKSIANMIELLDTGNINCLIEKGKTEVNGVIIDESVVRLVFKVENSTALKQYELLAQNDLMILLDVHLSQLMEDEGAAREIVCRIQKLRKKSRLVPTDKIDVYYYATENLAKIAKTWTDFIEKSIKAKFLVQSYNIPDNLLVGKESRQFKGCTLRLMLAKKNDVDLPVVDWINVMTEEFDKNMLKGLILLTTADGVLSFDSLVKHVQSLFNIYSDFTLLSKEGIVDSKSEICNLAGKTLQVLPNGARKNVAALLEDYPPFCKVKNFYEGHVSGTIILENPVGCVTIKEKDYPAIIKKWVTKRN